MQGGQVPSEDGGKGQEPGIPAAAEAAEDKEKDSPLLGRRIPSPANVFILELLT